MTHEGAVDLDAYRLHLCRIYGMPPENAPHWNVDHVPAWLGRQLPLPGFESYLEELEAARMKAARRRWRASGFQERSSYVRETGDAHGHRTRGRK